MYCDERLENANVEGEYKCSMMGKRTDYVNEYRASTEVLLIFNKAEKLYLKTCEEERKRITREQDFTYEIQRDKR